MKICFKIKFDTPKIIWNDGKGQQYINKVINSSTTNSLQFQILSDAETKAILNQKFY